MDSNDPWSELGLVDTGYEQAEEATRRLANLIRTFYQNLTVDDGMPIQVAAPISIHFAQAMLLMATKKGSEVKSE